MFTWRFWGIAVLASVGAAVVIGIPTVLIPNHFFIRMTPTAPLDYVIWLASVLLIGPLVALTLLFPLPQRQNDGSSGVIGMLLSFFSVGCPICNKLVVLLLGVGGAMTFFNPVRPFLGVASLAILGVTIGLRVHVLRKGCPVAPAARPHEPVVG